MKQKSLIILFLGYSLIMFLLEQFLINPQKSVQENAMFSLVSGVVFILLFLLYRWMGRRRKSAQ